MDPLTAGLINLGSDLIGGVAGYFTADRQARAFEHASDNQRAVGLAGYDALKTWYYQLTDITGLNVLLGQTQAREKGDVDRARYYFTYKTAEALRGSLVAVAGVGLIAVALLWALKEEA